MNNTRVSTLLYLIQMRPKGMIPSHKDRVCPLKQHAPNGPSDTNMCC